ncbi:MAG: peptidoglycan DD-metalloendopeptidase family protein [Nitriliruptoraceae bacterium]
MASGGFGRRSDDEVRLVRRFSRLIVAVIILAMLPSVAVADTTELQRLLEEAQRDREQAQAALQETRQQEGDARTRLAAAETELAREEAALAALQTELESARAFLAAAEERALIARERLASVSADLVEAEAEFNEVKQRLELRVRASYKYGPVSFAEAFAGVRSMADFLNSTQYVSHVLSGDRDLMQAVEASLERVAHQRELARQFREEAEREEADAEATAAQIELATAEQQRMAQQVRQRRREHAAALEALRTDRAAIEGHLAGLEAESRRIEAQIAEIARREAEAAHRRAVEEWERAVAAYEQCQADNAAAVADYAAALAEWEANNSGDGDGDGDGAGDGDGDGAGDGDGDGDANGDGTERPQEPAPKDCGEKPSSSTPAPPKLEGPAGGWIRPVSGRLSSPYGPRWGRMHNGVDLANAMGTPIRAAQSGTVVWRVTGCNPSSSWSCGGGFGNYVVIDHGGGFATVYAHMFKVGVTTGQQVGAGQAIGDVGNSGNSYGSHLHFELYDNGTRRNPCNYIAC